MSFHCSHNHASSKSKYIHYRNNKIDGRPRQFKDFTLKSSWANMYVFVVELMQKKRCEVKVHDRNLRNTKTLGRHMGTHKQQWTYMYEAWPLPTRPSTRVVHMPSICKMCGGCGRKKSSGFKRNLDMP